MHPRSFFKHKPLEVHLADFPLDFNHVLFQPCIIAFPVTPENPSLPVVVNQNRRVDASPLFLGCETIGHGQQRFAQRIFIRPFRTVGHSHPDTRMVGTDIPIKRPVPFHHLRSVCNARRPFEFICAQRYGIFPIVH